MRKQSFLYPFTFLVCQNFIWTPHCRAEVADKTSGAVELWGITLFMIVCVGVIARVNRPIAILIWLVYAGASLMSLLETHSSGLHQLLLAEQGWFWAYQNHACLAASVLALPLILRKRSNSCP